MPPQLGGFPLGGAPLGGTQGQAPEAGDTRTISGTLTLPALTVSGKVRAFYQGVLEWEWGKTRTISGILVLPELEVSGHVVTITPEKQGKLLIDDFIKEHWPELPKIEYKKYRKVARQTMRQISDEEALVAILMEID